jgi:hypothetical protein
MLPIFHLLAMQLPFLLHTVPPQAHFGGGTTALKAKDYQ